jgi:hypothetical protein
MAFQGLTEDKVSGNEKKIQNATKIFKSKPTELKSQHT